MSACVKAFGCRPHDDGATHSGAGVRKPPRETAGRRALRSVRRYGDFGAGGLLPTCVDRFSTAGELTASIAHEINQPLGSIMTNAETAQEILKSQSPDIVELKDIVNDILQDDRRATEVIRRMRSLLKKRRSNRNNSTSMKLCKRRSDFVGASRWPEIRNG
jgi:signal transduction histidine kinase